MEHKKNPKVDLTRYSGLFFNVGLILSLALIITAFEWRFYDDLEPTSLGALEEEETEILDIPITEMPPPPPPVVQQPEIVEVPDDEEIEEQVEEILDPPEDMPVQQTVLPDLPVNPDLKGPPPPPPKEKTDEIFLVVEDRPEPKGGMKAFNKYLKKNLKYPKQARRMGVEGKVFLEFIVDKDGSLTNIKVLKGIGAGCDEEAVRVIRQAPKWNPGKQRGRPVKVRMSIPVIFKLG